MQKTVKQPDLDIVLHHVSTPVLTETQREERKIAV